MAKKSYTEMFRELGRAGSGSKAFKDLYKKMKRDKEGVIEIDLDEMGGPSLEEVLRRYEKKGGLVKAGQPKLAKKGWK